MQLQNLIETIDEICKEKNLAKERVLEAVEKALATAYRKDFGEKNQNVIVKFDLVSGKMEIFDSKLVVEDSDLQDEEIKNEKTKKTKITKTKEKDKKKEIKEEKKDLEENEEGEEEKKFNPRKEIMISDAKKINKKVKIGDEIKTDLSVPENFGRVAAQAAKQVIVQKLREAEREVLHNEFKEKEGKILGGIVQRKEKGNVLVDLSKITAVLPFYEQIREEQYLPGQRIKVFVLEVAETTRGPEVIVSRAHEGMVRELFKSEIPEIANGIVEIKAIAREAGGRTKIAVLSKEEGVDPIGTCIGQRGSRIQTIIAELGGEKIDIVEYSENPQKFIINALSPAKIASVKIIDQEKNIAQVKVKAAQLSLAIGRGGQNVRLAAKLTGWKIEVVKEEEDGGEKNTKEETSTKIES